MREDEIKTEEGAALWRQARDGWSPVRETEAPDALWLAAYLDGSLAEDEAARLEARLAAEPALLDELLALREALQIEAAPAGVVARAQALRNERLRPERAERGAPARTSLLDGLFGAWLRPAVSTVAAVALVLACAGAFELGRYQGEQLDTTQTTEVAESDVPVDLLLEDLI